MTNFQTFFLIALCFLSSGSAFQVSAPAKHYSKPSSASASASVTQCFLHPDQAADLEACAYNLTKEFLEEERVKREADALYGSAVDPDTMTSTGLGPVAWCRRRLWPFANPKTQNLRP